MALSLKPRKCRVCGERFTPVKQIQPVCQNFECMVEFANLSAEKSKKRRERNDREKMKAYRESIKTLRDFKKEAQTAVNAYVRERDKDLPCISCGRYHTGQYHAGHYLSRGAHPELALNERNIYKQCMPCNTHLSGNQINFRKGIIERKGLKEVEWLEGYHPVKKMTVDELKDLTAYYKRKLKELKSANSD